MNTKRRKMRLAAIIAAVTLTTGFSMPMQKISLAQSVLTVSAEEETYTEGTSGIFTYEKYSDHIVISNCDKTATSAEIPETIEGLPVTGIGIYSFQGTKLKSVEIPNSIKEIGHWAFSMCEELESVKIADSVEKIGIRAFELCPALTEIEFPDHLVEINSNAFDSTPWLTEQRKKDPLVIVNGDLVDGQTCKGDVVIPSEVKYISQSAFARNFDITSVVVHSGVKKINDNTFFYCGGLTSAEIKGADFIDSMAFCGCTKLSELKLSGKLTAIDERAFSDIGGTATITFYGSKETWEKVDKPSEDPFLKNSQYIFDESHAEEPEDDPKPETKVVYGDANCDGDVSLADAVLIMQSLANPNRFGENGSDDAHITSQGTKNADCCNVGDGVTNKDALAIQKKMLDLVELPEND